MYNNTNRYQSKSKYAQGDVIEVKTNDNELIFINETTHKEWRMEIKLT